MMKPTQYSEEFKREAVRKAEVSGNVSRTARELGVSNCSCVTLVGIVPMVKCFGEEISP